MWIYVMGGAFRQGALDYVNVGHGKDALFVCVWDLPFIPVLIHLPYHNDLLTLHTHTHTKMFINQLIISAVYTLLL